jgi:epoxyqueuosine reductase
MDKQHITDVIRAFVASDPRNAVPEIPGLTIFEEPLVAVASAGDQLYGKLKDPQVIGPHHISPGEWLPGARSVVSWFLPFNEEIVRSNRPEGPPSAEWYLSYHWGEAFNNALRDRVTDTIITAGHSAVAPMRDSRFVMQTRTSNWSERHAAYIAGMGSFGLSYSFITERGCAGRFGSVVTDLVLDVSPRRAVSLRENCLGADGGTCVACAERCPVGAITPEKKDHDLCMGFLKERVVPHYSHIYADIRSFCCGKCQTGVPCARTNPRRPSKKGTP